MHEEIKKTLEALNQGKLILYPTDTVWGIGCDATNEEAIKKVYQLKQRDDSKALICLVSDLRMLQKYVYEIPDAAYDIIDLATKPTTIIYDRPLNIAKNLIANDDTLAIRIASDEFCQKLIRQFKRPLVSTSANISGLPTPKSFSEISNEILKGVDYVVNLHREKKNSQPSSIIKIGNDATVKVIRK
ncbi:L-threonylcarbamoyladenylate synthase [Galbibacter pacificus]|uniref:L-threonylcarbamoyladenylate synthase n=1 Tax=Galbibacter pacificus TaxID=2996052 RepID=A0ABT6FUI2_9FLAO|nr:L-threonylcarbamoyladenylate synthase [Galbibacter pacificus]MDG3583602.1 L-threonylcarbamoyladenylate synthase [Galbibacter pacificus]MDG3586922.1 L-threonylcarbamoyladenylate synthase [Galbibacter pacificus]